MSQEDVCTEVNGGRLVHLRHYQELEAGRGNPTVRMLVRLAKLFDTSFSTLTNVDRKAPRSEPERRSPRRRRNWDGLAARQRRIAEILAERDPLPKPKKPKQRKTKRVS